MEALSGRSRAAYSTGSGASTRGHDQSPMGHAGGFVDPRPGVAGGPAIDAINDGTCPRPAKDQRGVKRPDGNGDGSSACDIGAFKRR
jgi:hypothetical protein